MGARTDRGASGGDARTVETGPLTRYIFMSSVAAYSDSLNHYENDALAPDDHPDPYVRNKARVVPRCTSAQRDGGGLVTPVPPQFFIDTRARPSDCRGCDEP